MTCPLCDGTGWKPVETDGVRRVTRCDCWRTTLAHRLMADARIPPRYQRCDLDSFVTYPNEKLLRAVARTKRFAEAFPVVEKGLFFIGPPGIGKTHLAVAVLKHVIRGCGARGLFYDTRDLLRVIRSTYDPVVHTTEIQVLGPVMEAELLVLDDLGAEKTSEWVEETLNLIVNTRYSDKRPTIFTSNYDDLPDLTDPTSLIFRVGARMHSRLKEMCEFVEYDGADYRDIPPNAASDDLLMQWKLQRRPKKLPAKSSGGAKVQIRDRVDLKWPGGRAGS